MRRLGIPRERKLFAFNVKFPFHLLGKEEVMKKEVLDTRELIPQGLSQAVSCFCHFHTLPASIVRDLYLKY